jgi:hypothetical protein
MPWLSRPPIVDSWWRWPLLERRAAPPSTQTTARPGRAWRRVLVALTVAGVCLLLLAASAGAALPPTVYLDQSGLSEAIQPSSFRIPEYHSADLLTLVNAAVSDVSWSSWGGSTAEGSGEALIQWTDASTGPHAQDHATVPVSVTAGGLTSCGGIGVYTSLVINPAPGAEVPPHFAQVQRDKNVLPCAVHAGGYVAGEAERHDPGGCFFKGLRELIVTPPFSLDYCAMRWQAWGSSSTIGAGVARIGFKQYGLRVKLKQIRWCSKWTVSYTSETAEVWGTGEPITGQGNVTPSDATRLTALIGRHGQPHKTVHEAMAAGAGCKLLS